MNINNITTKLVRTLLLGTFILAAGACSDRDELITETQFDRLFMPSKLETRVQSKTNVRISWECLSTPDSYTIELFADDPSMAFQGTPSVTATTTESPYVISNLLGETIYSVRIKAVSEAKESNWNMTTFSTDAEQILEKVAAEDLEATEVTLRWPAGQTATSIVLTPGDITYTVTADDIAAGAATITGLTSETEYTAKLMNGAKVRGTITFTTLIDLGGAQAINPDDNIVDILDAANDGDEFVIFAGEYDLGSYSLTKAISLTGYKPNEKPIIRGSFTLGANVSSITLKALEFSGKNSEGIVTQSRLFVTAGTPTIGDITITGCEVKDYKVGIIQNNTAATLSNITISDCIFANLAGDGGDGIDIRGGSLASLKIENSTFYSGIRSLLRLQASSDVEFTNCTFYQICTLDSKDNTGLFRSSTGGTLKVEKCLFVETGVDSPANASSGNWAKSGNINAKVTTTYSSNYYYNCKNLWVGQYTNPSAVDATEANPSFKDAANGDFTLGNEDLSYNKIGDPRWW